MKRFESGGSKAGQTILIHLDSNNMLKSAVHLENANYFALMSCVIMESDVIRCSGYVGCGSPLAPDYVLSLASLVKKMSIHCLTTRRTT